MTAVCGESSRPRYTLMVVRSRPNPTRHRNPRQALTYTLVTTSVPPTALHSFVVALYPFEPQSHCEASLKPESLERSGM